MSSSNAFFHYCNFTNISSANDFYFTKMKEIIMPEICVEVVGLEDGSSGRSCSMHAICGSTVHPDKHLKICSTYTLNLKQKKIPALGVYALCANTAEVTCLVGYLRRHKLRHTAEYEGQYIIVTEMLKESEDSSKLAYNNAHKGCCITRILYDSLPLEV